MMSLQNITLRCRFNFDCIYSSENELNLKQREREFTDKIFIGNYIKYQKLYIYIYIIR